MTFLHKNVIFPGPIFDMTNVFWPGAAIFPLMKVIRLWTADVLEDLSVFDSTAFCFFNPVILSLTWEWYLCPQWPHKWIIFQECVSNIVVAHAKEVNVVIFFLLGDFLEANRIGSKTSTMPNMGQPKMLHLALRNNPKMFFEMHFFFRRDHRTRFFFLFSEKDQFVWKRQGSASLILCGFTQATYVPHKCFHF